VVTVVIRLSETRARGICSRWMEQISPGVFCGVLPFQAVMRLKDSLSEYDGVVILSESRGKLTRWESTGTKTQENAC
jgi:hypothetical protein